MFIWYFGNIGYIRLNFRPLGQTDRLRQKIKILDLYFLGLGGPVGLVLTAFLDLLLLKTF